LGNDVVSNDQCEIIQSPFSPVRFGSMQKFLLIVCLVEH